MTKQEKQQLFDAAGRVFAIFLALVFLPLVVSVIVVRVVWEFVATGWKIGDYLLELRK